MHGSPCLPGMTAAERRGCGKLRPGPAPRGAAGDDRGPGYRQPLLSHDGQRAGIASGWGLADLFRLRRRQPGHAGPAPVVICEPRRYAVQASCSTSAATTAGRLRPRPVHTGASGRNSDYEMLLVVNCARPLTRTAEDTVQVLREIEAGLRPAVHRASSTTRTSARKLTAEDVLSRCPVLPKPSAVLTGLPCVFMTCCSRSAVSRCSAGTYRTGCSP